MNIWNNLKKWELKKWRYWKGKKWKTIKWGYWKVLQFNT